MMTSPDARPSLEIPDEVWDRLEEHDLINFSVPLLAPPIEFEGRVYWGGLQMMKVGRDIAAFSSFSQADAHMPYGRVFDVIEGRGCARALIYGVYFERGEMGEWHMMYRMMNVRRALSASEDVPGMPDEPAPLSTFMLSATEPSEWFTVNDYFDHYCRALQIPWEGADRAIRACAASLSDVAVYGERHILPLDDGRAIYVPGEARCPALLFSAHTGTILSRLAMDDPDHLIGRFWSLSKKIFICDADRFEMQAVASDAWHYAQALSAARLSLREELPLTAAAFY